MDINSQIREGVRFIIGIEDGNLPVADCYMICENLDPVLVSLMVHYIRHKCSRPSVRDSSGGGGLSRLLELSSTYPDLVNEIREGEKDSLFQWFEDGYQYQDYFHEPEAFVELIVEKLEG